MATEPKQTTSTEHHSGAAQQRSKVAADRLNEDKKRVAQEREERAKQIAERDKHRGTPTPTQEECDLLKLGHHVELANDGSGPDPNENLNTVRHIGGKSVGERERDRDRQGHAGEKPASGEQYPTRQVTAKT